ncbi:MAG: glycosyltransferase family 2 protein [Bacteroidales bacterium]|jgi:glycosyltransferase involved in cell wall biosynthesis|nr:glycosyltransferase family 2 protein [Bacteroidales bacterium]
MEKILENTILSLTSYPARINTVYMTIQSLLDQTATGEKIVLWLSQEDFYEKENALPKELLELTARGLTIEWCDNLKPYKKLIPALRKYPDKIIITFDDDIIYNKATVEYLYDCHIKHPHDVIAHRISRMFFNEENELDLFPRPMYYDENSVTLNYCGSLKELSFFNKLTGCGGVLYPPRCLHSDVLDKDKCMSLAPTNDDIWFWLQGVRNKTKVRVPERHFPEFQEIPGTQDVALNNINNLATDRFSQQLKNIMTAYSEIKEILQSENDENLEIINEIIDNSKCPLVSIVCFVHNHSFFIRKCLDRIINQKIKVSLEILVIDNDSTDGTADIIRDYEEKFPEIIKACYQKGRGNSSYIPSIPPRLFPVIQGKYVAFCEGSDYWTDPYKLKKQFTFMERFPDFSLTSSGFSETSEGIITDKTIRCGKENGFDYHNIDIRGCSHLQISTLFCRKNVLENINKKRSNFKYWNNIHQCYFLLIAGSGRYFSENFVVHNVIDECVLSKNQVKERIRDQYHVFKELYKKTKDVEISKLYFRYLGLLLDNRLYKNKIEKMKLLFKKHAKDTDAMAAAIKKVGAMFLRKKNK